MNIAIQEHVKAASQNRQLIAEKLLRVVRKPCQRILLVQPLQTPERFFNLERALSRRLPNPPPYGCGVLSKNLKLRGYETSILDLNFDLLLTAYDDPKTFDFTAWKKMLMDRVLAFKPDLVAITCMFSISHENMCDAANLIKQTDPGVAIITGGVHVTNARKMVLEACQSIDFIGLYEGDKSFADTVDFVNGKCGQDKLAQIATLIDGKYVPVEDRATPDMRDIQQAPDYTGLKIDAYDSMGQFSTYGFLVPDRKATTVLTNRGCRAHCSFCSVATFNGQGVRIRDPKNVVDEIEHLVKNHGIQHVMWLDDDLFFNAKRTLTLFNEIVRRNLKITWDASNGIIAAAITPELAAAAVESGCIGLNLGIESGNPQILKEVHKPGTLNNFRKAKEILGKYPHLFIKGFLMIGFPNETWQQMHDTMSFAMELRLDWYPTQILTPLPSTEIYRTMLEVGLIEDKLSTSTVAQMAGAHGKLRQQEENEKKKATEFLNPFDGADMTKVPPKDKLGDIWFYLDYKANYEKILTEEHPVKLKNVGLWLVDVCDRITKENPLGNLFLAVIRQKLGETEEAKRRAAIAETYLNESAYWQTRFRTLGLYEVLNGLKTQFQTAHPQSGRS